MALFGAPIALEEAPQRAIRSALSIYRQMAKFSDRMKQDKKNLPPLKMRVGINAGLRSGRKEGQYLFFYQKKFST